MELYAPCLFYFPQNPPLENCVIKNYTKQESQPNYPLLAPLSEGRGGESVHSTPQKSMNATHKKRTLKPLLFSVSRSDPDPYWIRGLLDPIRLRNTDPGIKQTLTKLKLPVLKIITMSLQLEYK